MTAPPNDPSSAAGGGVRERPDGLKQVTQLFRRVSGVFIARLVGAIIGLVSQIFLARLLGPEELATYFLALGLAGVLTIVCALGIPSITVSVISEFRVTGDMQGQRRFLSSTRRYVAFAMVPAIAGSALLVALWLSGSSDVWLPLLIGIASVPALAFLRLNGAVANAHRRFYASYLPDLIGKPLLALLAVLLITMGAAAASTTTVLLVYLGGVVLLMGIQFYLVEAAVSDNDRTSAAMTDRTVKDSQTAPVNWFHRAWPMIPLALFVGLFGDLQILLVSPHLPADQLAVFGVCIKLALLLGFISQITHQVFLPDAAEAYANDDKSSLGEQIRRANILATVLCLVGWLGLLLIGDRLLALFGKAFEDGYWCLIVLGLSSVARAYMGPGAQFIVLAKAERRALWASLTSVVLLALLNALLAPFAGILGASIAVLASITIWSCWLAVLARHRTGLDVAGWVRAGGG
ncbi:MAG: lipopolysaccharide biosynthesis protein [Pseudomonadota bacterium]